MKMLWKGIKSIVTVKLDFIRTVFSLWVLGYITHFLKQLILRAKLIHILQVDLDCKTPIGFD